MNAGKRAAAETHSRVPLHHEGPQDSGVRRANAHEAPMPTAGFNLTWAFVLAVGLTVTLASGGGALLNFFEARNAAHEALDLAGTSAAFNLANHEAVIWEPNGAPTSLRQITIQPVKLQRRGEQVEGYVYRAAKQDTSGAITYTDVVVDSPMGEFGRAFSLSLILSCVVVIAASIGVAFLLARRLTGPLSVLIEDVRVISHGHLEHSVRVPSGGEVGLLAKSVDRMLRVLREAREAERESEQREHELAVASEVRASLLPEHNPNIPGYEIAAHVSAADSVGGDLYDTLDQADEHGSVSLFVAGISARGVPGAMLMTMARAYLHQAIESHASPAEALKVANRAITRDMRRGLFVTALVARLEIAEGRVRVACAGHKAPLLIHRAATNTIEVLHPEGIALGFDGGPVFDRTIREAEIRLEPGDRIVLTSAGVAALRNDVDDELGEKGFASLVRKHAGKVSEAFCQLVGVELERFRGDAVLVEDVVIVTLRRKPRAGAAA